MYNKNWRSFATRRTLPRPLPTIRREGRRGENKGCTVSIINDFFAVFVPNVETRFIASPICQRKYNNLARSAPMRTIGAQVAPEVRLARGIAAEPPKRRASGAKVMERIARPREAGARPNY